ncbi:hypothetical protein KUTeg_023051 [Tegillarca granosa]|uniref:BPL/LPL catalytic domain-containing protein n=1 Tax=Tegillarca granosa TaxID=220873 RepID=A0ABQ9E5H1_TEGGR|nr:hypothetical protein KUTeg_023051 [Tegillarca granosa]
MSLYSFDSKLFDSHLQTRWLGRSIICKDVTETTMDDAKLAANTGSPCGTVILAETQTKARGTKSHKWNALNKGNLYVSLIINRKIQQGDFVDTFDVEVSGTLSTMKVLQDLGLKDVKMKWPNDLWVRGHKLGGFLAEISGKIPGINIIIHTSIFLVGSSENIIVLGIGLNVNADIRRHPDLHTIATSVRCELNGQIMNREKLFADICNNLEETLEWSRDKLYTEAMENLLFNPGTTLKINHALGGKISIGQLEKIQDNWDIIFKDESGQVWQGTSQQYSIRPYTTKTVYVYNGILTASWSSTLLIKTFSALVDTCELAEVGNRMQQY